MIAADLETAGQKRLLAEGYDPACALLVAPHHGAASSLNPRFLAAAHPEVMIISAAGRRGLPSPRFTAAARALGSSVYATHESGCVHAALGPDSQLEAGAAPR